MNTTRKECGFCNEEFDEESKCPRVLNCFHTLCTTCIDQLIRNDKKRCPFCRKNFKANNANDIMLNVKLLNFMKYGSHQGPNFRKAKKDLVATRRKMRINALKKETREISCHHHLNCQEAEKQIEKSIKEVINLQKNITQENYRLENDVLSKIHDVISRNNRTSEELNKINTRLHNRLKEIQIKNMQLDDVKGKLDACTANTYKETGLILDEVKEINTGIGRWIENFKELMCQEEKTLQTTEKKMKRTKEQINIILEVLSSREKRDENIDPIPGTSAMAIQEDWVCLGRIVEGSSSQEERNEEIDPIPGTSALAIQEELLPGHITAESLREMSNPLKQLVKQGRIFAVQQHQGRRRCARISITSDDKLCLHHLREEPPPPNVHILEHDAVMRLVDPSSRLTFLELAAQGKSLGRMKIRLFGDTKGARNFSFLCTGEMGPSYANTNILKVYNKGNAKWEFVQFGDYEYNNGEGGKQLVAGLRQECGREEYQHQRVAGSVRGVWGYGDAIAAQFVIHTKDFSGKVHYSCFGILVEEEEEDGLQVLREAISNYPDISKVKIKECGIILSC